MRGHDTAKFEAHRCNDGWKVGRMPILPTLFWLQAIPFASLYTSESHSKESALGLLAPHKYSLILHTKHAVNSDFRTTVEIKPTPPLTLILSCKCSAETNAFLHPLFFFARSVSVASSLVKVSVSQPTSLTHISQNDRKWAKSHS